MEHEAVRLEQPTDGDPEILLVPYDELQKTVKSCGKDEELLIDYDGPNYVSIKYLIGSQLVEQKVETCPVEEFPEIPRIEGEPIPVPESLRDSLHQAFECASTDETRYILNGAYLDVGDENCHQVVGTDGRHLFASNSFKLPLKKGVIVPTHRFLQWKEFNRDGEWKLEIAPTTEKDSPNRLQINSRRWRFITSEIEGNYPNWRQVVPSSSETKTQIEVDPEATDQVIQTIQRMPCHDQTNFVIGLDITGNKVQLLGKGQTAEYWTKVEVPTVNITGKPMLIFLNRNFLTKALRFSLTRIELIDPMSPLRFSNAGRQMIVMPTRSEAVPPTTSTSIPEQNGAGAAEPMNSGTDPQPTATATTNERSTTVHNDTNTTGESTPTSPTPPQTNASRIEEALELIDALKDSFQDNIAALKDLSSKLKAVQKEQKTTEREFHSIRSTLRTLQSVKL
ncbi:MAG: DNA polymerase III subunit beta [Verrucomicrobiaceae bacterium]|nr:MAG: DNA polymerase III subunit beta [Verrucomicrobiaceae bacterium]